MSDEITIDEWCRELARLRFDIGRARIEVVWADTNVRITRVELKQYEMNATFCNERLSELSASLDKHIAAVDEKGWIP